MRNVLLLSALALVGLSFVVYAASGSGLTADPLRKVAIHDNSGNAAAERRAAAARPEARIRRTNIERDLVLEVERVSPKTLRIGAKIELAVSLRNVSPQRTHHVVKPGDGSEVGWREPHVYFTAQINRGDGVFRDVDKAELGRCGNYDDDWMSDVIALAPGEALPLNKWITTPDMTLALEDAGTVRIHVHYAYRPSIPKSSDEGLVLTGPISEVPDYEIVSAPIEFILR